MAYKKIKNFIQTRRNRGFRLADMVKGKITLSNILSREEVMLL